MKRTLFFLYGLISYALFLGVFLYAAGFVADIAVPKTIDSGPAAPLVPALLINTGLLTLFALQHSVMARPGFKRVWMRLVPPAIERSTYVLFSSAVLALLFWQWRPIPMPVWSVETEAARAVLWAVHIGGWLIVLVSTFFISHAHLFGLMQVRRHKEGREMPELRFQTPGLYRLVRHPIMLGFLIAFWAAPDMSVGHLLFAAASTGYILVALQFEERDLIAVFGDRYRAYREQVRMLLPVPRRNAGLTVDERQPAEEGVER